jgi:hypothetical protein
MHLIRDLLDQLLVDPAGDPAGRADDFSLTVADDGIFVDSILSGGGILADDLGVIGHLCEGATRAVRRRALRRRSIPWISVSEVAEHALTVAATGMPPTAPRTESGLVMRLRAVRRLPLRTADGTRLHLVDLQVIDAEPPDRMQVTGLIVRPRHRFSWPISLRPRPRGPAHNWRFVPAASVQMTPTALVVDHVYDGLAPMRDSDVAPPPKRIPRADA